MRKEPMTADELTNLPREETMEPEETQVAPKPRMGALTAMMALPEPARTEALERAVNSGASFQLRSATGQEVRCRYGNTVLVVPPQPREFMAAHAIHLLWTLGKRVVEA